MIFLLPCHDRAVILILLENEVCSCADHCVESRELAGYKSGYFFKGFSFKCHQKVIAARDQIYGIDFRILINPLGTSYNKRLGIVEYLYIEADSVYYPYAVKTDR